MILMEQSEEKEYEDAPELVEIANEIEKLTEEVQIAKESKRRRERLEKSENSEQKRPFEEKKEEKQQGDIDRLQIHMIMMIHKNIQFPCKKPSRQELVSGAVYM